MWIKGFLDKITGSKSCKYKKQIFFAPKGSGAYWVLEKSVKKPLKTKISRKKFSEPKIPPGKNSSSQKLYLENPGTEGKNSQSKIFTKNSCRQSSHKKDSWSGKSYRGKIFSVENPYRKSIPVAKKIHEN